MKHSEQSLSRKLSEKKGETFIGLQTDRVAVGTVTSLVESFYTSHVAGVEVESFHCTDGLLATKHLLETQTTTRKSVSK